MTGTAFLLTITVPRVPEHPFWQNEHRQVLLNASPCTHFSAKVFQAKFGIGIREGGGGDIATSS